MAKEESPVGAGCGCLVGSIVLSVLITPLLGVITLLLGIAIIVMIEVKKRRDD